MIADMDQLLWVADVYKRDLEIEKYFIGYLQHPYVSMYTGPRLPGAVQLPASGRRPSAGTSTVSVPRRTSRTRWPT